ncbi:oligosaccharide flippase family protein [Duganella sp. BJB1802]|uniref:oligosaccharide flippase family protein n=1 Tax=Duganella sp. BJB1802 TaxID=2744575 RepID=UPI001E3A479E|nr:oligosaccharide flippase family protein [Duganella sp. BJB1802]
MALPAGQLLGLATGLAAARLLLRPPSSRTRARRPLVRLRLLARRLRRGALPTPAQRRYLHAHRAFWRYALPSNVLNAAIGPLPLLLIGARHGALAAGQFALTQRVLAAPVSLLAASVQEVFKRESVRQYQNSGNCRPAWRHAARVLLLLGFLPSLLLLLAAPPLFAFAFGAPWRAAGELAQILAPLYFLNFIASPLSYVFFVAGRQKIELAWQLALFAMTLAVFAAPLTLHQSVAAYATGYSLLYLVYLRMSYRYALDRDPAGRLHAAR